MQAYSHRLPQRHAGEPQRMRDILVEWLAQYQRRFPQAKITVIETPESAAVEPGLFDAAAASVGLPLLRSSETRPCRRSADRIGACDTRW